VPPSIFPILGLSLRLLGLMLVATAGGLHSAPALPLHDKRSGPNDLAVKGRLIGVPAGESRFVRWSDLATLPTTKLTLTGEFVPGEQEVTVVFLSDLWAHLPVSAGADSILATCTDGYASVFIDTFIRERRPFLILAINGQGPEKWPPPGLKFNPRPYVISVASVVSPGVESLLDIGHKKPWGVDTIEIAAFQERFAAFYSGRWSDAPPLAKSGREIWIHSCTSCHAGPADSGTFGGTKGGRPFEVLVGHATQNPAYFRTYVRDPKGFASTAKMEPHPHYSDAQLDALIAFLRLPPKL
jgi:cytochrome c2